MLENSSLEILSEQKPLREVARELRLPAYVVSAIERGEVHPFAAMD